MFNAELLAVGTEAWLWSVAIHALPQDGASLVFGA